MTLTPGAYLKRRRIASGRSLPDVAARLQTEPHITARERAEWLEAMEADVAPLSLRTVVALHEVIPFDLLLLAQLVRVQLGLAIGAPRMCRVCACSEHDACTTHAPGAWADDETCPTCAPVIAAVGAAA